MLNVRILFSSGKFNYAFFTIKILLIKFHRLGTCGGIGIEGGTVVVSTEGVDGQLRNTYEMVINH